MFQRVPLMLRATLIGAALSYGSTAVAGGAPPVAYEHQLQARSNLLVNDEGFNLPPGSSFNSISPALNDLGELTFRVQIVPGRMGSGVWFGQGGKGSLVCFAEETDEAVLSDPRINALGQIVFKQAFGSLNGVYLCDPFLQQAARVTVGPLGTTDWGSPDINDTGEIAYRAGFNGPQVWVSRAVGGEFAIHVADQSADLDSPYNFLFSPGFSSQRVMAGAVRRAASGGQPQFTEMRAFQSDGSSVLIARDRSGDAKSPISTFDSTSPSINASGQVAFIASLVGGGRALFVGDGGALTQIARTGIADLSVIDFFGPGLNDDGLVVFRGRDSQGRALFVGDGTGIRRVVGLGDRVPTDLGLAQIGQHSPELEIFSGRPAINAAGEIAYIAGLHPDGDSQVEWGSGVFIARVRSDAVFADGFEGVVPTR